MENTQKKSIGEWIESLPDGDLKTRMQRVRLKYFQRKVDSLAEAVGYFTEWVETLEGYSWWAGVSQGLKGEISTYPFTKKDYDAGYELAEKTKRMLENPAGTMIRGEDKFIGVMLVKWESKPTHMEVEIGEYERLLAVERAYRILCEEIGEKRNP